MNKRQFFKCLGAAAVGAPLAAIAGDGEVVIRGKVIHGGLKVILPNDACAVRIEGCEIHAAPSESALYILTNKSAPSEWPPDTGLSWHIAGIVD